MHLPSTFFLIMLGGGSGRGADDEELRKILVSERIVVDQEGRTRLLLEG